MTPPLPPPNGMLRDGALPRHPRRQRRHFVERDVGVIADAALGRAERDVVLHAVAGEDLDLAVVHLHRARHDDLPLGVGEDLPDAGSRLRMRAAPSNSWSIAPKTLPCAAMVRPRHRTITVAAANGQTVPTSDYATVNRSASHAGMPTRQARTPSRGPYNVELHEDRHRSGRDRQAALGARDARADAREVARAARPVHDHLRPADRAPLHRRGRRRRSTTTATSATRASFPTRAAFTPPATAASSGRCGSSPGSARRKRPTSATRT